MYSYMDESCDDHGNRNGCRRLVARGSVFELERKWEMLRTRPDIDIAYFKASECKNGPSCSAQR